MARNASGVYSLPAGSTVANGDASDASDINTPFLDLELDNNNARPIVAGGTGATTAAGARTALGLAIGSNVQAYDAQLSDLAGIASADTLVSLAALGSSGSIAYTTATDTWAEATITSFGRTWIALAGNTAARDQLNLGNAATFDVANTATAEAGTSDTDLMSPLRVAQYHAAASIGVDQTWQDVSGSRAVSTSYQNTTGRPIMVNIWCNQSDQLEVSTDNATWVVVAYGIDSANDDTMASAIVPDTHYYRLNGSNFAGWTELR